MKTILLIGLFSVFLLACGLGLVIGGGILAGRPYSFLIGAINTMLGIYLGSVVIRAIRWERRWKNWEKKRKTNDQNS